MHNIHARLRAKLSKVPKRECYYEVEGGEVESEGWEMKRRGVVGRSCVCVLAIELP